MSITGIINEEWRSVNGYANYQVSNIGRVRNVETEKILKQTMTKLGYCQIGLYREGLRKFLYIHRIVAHAFIENPDNRPCVDHVNHDVSNNTILNLRWVSMSENAMNRTKRQNVSSKYKGVSFRKRDNDWHARIMIDGKMKSLGSFTDEKQAAARYNETAVELFGEHACLNEISSDEEEDEAYEFEEEEEETDDATA